MRRFIAIYRRILILNASTLVAYRSNFVNSILSSISWGIFSFISMFLLTGSVRSVFGWSRDEILLLTGLYSILIGVFHTFFTRNFERLAVIVDRGNLDAVLLLPIDSQLYVSIRYVSYTTLVRIVLGAIFTTYMVGRIGIPVTVPVLAVAVGLLVAGIVLLYSIWFIVCTLLLFNPQISNLVSLMFSVSGMARYPREMYRPLGTALYVILMPLTFIVIAPARAFLGKLTVPEVAGILLCGAGLLGVSRIFWFYALRRYTGAGS